MILLFVGSDSLFQYEIKWFIYVNWVNFSFIFVFFPLFMCSVVFCLFHIYYTESYLLFRGTTISWNLVFLWVRLISVQFSHDKFYLISLVCVYANISALPESSLFFLWQIIDDFFDDCILWIIYMWLFYNLCTSESQKTKSKVRYKNKKNHSPFASFQAWLLFDAKNMKIHGNDRLMDFNQGAFFYYLTAPKKNLMRVTVGTRERRKLPNISEISLHIFGIFDAFY